MGGRAQGTGEGKKGQGGGRMIEAVAFDLGGVLVPDRLCVLTRVIGDAAGIPASQVYERLARAVREVDLGRASLAEFAAGAAAEFPLTLEPEEMVGILLTGYNLRRPVAEDAARLKVPVVIVSNNGPEVWGAVRSGTALLDRLRPAAAVISSEVGTAKPDPEIFRVAQERLGLPGGRIMFFDHRPRNADAARKAGWRAATFTAAAWAAFKRDNARLFGAAP